MNKTFKMLDQNDCVLKTTRIDIWQFSLDIRVSEAEQALLSDDEQTRAKRFYFERHRRRFTVARATLRLILAHYLALPAKDLLFGYNAQGKPHVDHTTSSLQFNLSHSDELALLAVGKTNPLGIDLEFFSARPYEGIGQQLFSQEENNALRALPSKLKPLAFFHVWSQKEAFIKAIGLGLSYPTQRVTMPILPPTHQGFVDPEYESNWTLISFMPKPLCCAALCHHPSVQDIRYTTRALE